MRMPQFTLARILLAMFWLAVCFTAWGSRPTSWMIQNQNQIGVWLIFFSFRFFTIPTAIGALFGHTLRGFVIGVALYVSLLAFMFFALVLSGDTL